MASTHDDQKSISFVQGKLNAFQRTMLHWNSMHPYNAVHVVRIAGAPDQESLKRAIDQTLNRRALTGLTLDLARGTYSYRGGAAGCEIRDLDFAGSTRVLLAGEIERQLNTPFPQAGPFSPFRFFAARCEDSFALGLAYLHAVADAECIALLLKEIVERYAGSKERDPSTAGDHVPSTPGHPLFSHPGAFARKLIAFPSLMRDMRRSCRPSYRDTKDLHNGFALFPLKPESLRCLVEAAKSWGITVNDLVLALLMKSCALLAIERESAERRKNISVACIVNTRRDLAGKSRGAFGLFLGSFVITHPVPAQTGLAELAKDIGRSTLKLKRQKLYLATPLELFLARFVLSLFSIERRKKWYQKNYPLWGGLTNMNINSLWQPREAAQPTDYLRAVSTGPASPLVLSFTTAGQAANIGLSYRSTVFSAADVERLMGCFLETLADLEVRH
jgi:NRPS condensation-like uncharacterized protein